jgi:hypothetical protein
MAKEIKLKEENKIDTERMKEFKESYYKGEVKPVIQMEEGRITPLYILIANVRAPKIGNTKMNYMIAASHLKETDEISVAGRMRYETTGRKTVFSLRENFKLSELDQAKKKIREMYDSMRDKMWLIETKPAVEINFGANESLDSIIKKMDESGEFDIGTLEK